MQKDAKRFAETGGWGFEEFRGDSHTEWTLNEQGKPHASPVTPEKKKMILSLVLSASKFVEFWKYQSFEIR